MIVRYSTVLLMQPGHPLSTATRPVGPGVESNTAAVLVILVILIIILTTIIMTMTMAINTA